MKHFTSKEDDSDYVDDEDNAMAATVPAIITYYTFHYPHYTEQHHAIMEIPFTRPNGERDYIPYQFDEQRVREIIALLKCVESESDLSKAFLFIKHQFVDGTVIELENGQKGCIDWESSEGSALRYYLFKKDGTVGRTQRILYANTTYHKL